MLIKTKGRVNYDPRENGDVLILDIPDEEILALGKQYFKLASKPTGDVIKELPFEESNRKIFDDILEKYSVDEITENLGAMLNDGNAVDYYGEHDAEWKWLWQFIVDIYHAAKEK